MTVLFLPPAVRAILVRRARKLLLACPLLLVGAAACSGDKLTDLSATGVRAQTLAQVSLLPRAVIIAVGDSHQLNLSSISFTGEPIPEGATVTYTSGDSTRVTVSPSGMVQGRAVTTVFVSVYVSVNYRGISRSDRVYIQVVPSKTPVDAMQFDPVGAIQVGSPAPYNVRFSRGGIEVPGLFATVEYLDKTGIASIDVFQRTVTPRQTGTVKLVGRVNAFGVELVDTLVLDVINPSMQTIMFMDDWDDPNSMFSGADGLTLFLQEYGMVMFMNLSPVSFKITLTDPDGVSRVLDLARDDMLMEMFMTPGDYTWKANTRPPSSGIIRVK